MSVSGLLADNIDVLTSAAMLVRDLDDETYTRIFDLTDGSIGDHVRHVVEGYQALIRGLSQGLVDYDTRARDPRIAASTAAGERALQAQIAALEALRGHTQAPVEVRLATSTEREPAALRSGLARELAFVHSHAVHHFALIAMLLRAAGHRPDATFGVAPSTLRYRRDHGLPLAGCG